MKYCIQYTKGFRYLKQIDEVIIPLYSSHLKTCIEELSDNQRIVIDIKDIKEVLSNLKSFIEMKEQHSNIAVRLPGGFNVDLAAETAIKLEEVGIPFFFNFRVDKWDTLMALVEVGVSDIYVVNELGFNLDEVSTLCKKNNVNIRVYPNVAQMSAKVTSINHLKSFFIRPEDMMYYEPFVDVCEFFGPEDRQSVLYKIYQEEGKWLGDLKDLIIGLDLSINNRCIVPVFGSARISCRKKCYQGKCISCDKVLTIEKQLNEAKIEVNQVKKGE